MRVMLVFCALVALAACGRQDDSAAINREIERNTQRDAAAAQSAGADNQQFLDAAKAAPGAVTTASGLVYVFTHHSSNARLAKPPANAQVLVHYEGKLPNGHVFDSSFQRGQPAAFPLDGVVPGFSEVIQQMRPGDELIATFPPALGYGPQEQRNPQTGQVEIPANSVLQFRIQLLAFQAPGGAMVQAPRH